MDKNKIEINRFKVQDETYTVECDYIASEEPLQISLVHRGVCRVFTITMRTPGEDENLIYGLLYTEGVITSSKDVIKMLKSKAAGDYLDNQWEVFLSDEVLFDLGSSRRQMVSYSGCGLCGKTNLKALELHRGREIQAINLRLNVRLVKQLKSLLAEQPLFSQTGGVHAAGFIYQQEGKLNFKTAPFYEDVGRHNALDKLIGHELVANDLQQVGLLVLSGRIGYELVQKAVMAGFAIVIALGAPSSLAVQAANQFGIVLVGFAKDESFNLYTADTGLLDTVLLETGVLGSALP